MYRHLYTWTHTLNRTRSTASYRRKKVHVRYLSSADERLLSFNNAFIAVLFAVNSILYIDGLHLKCYFRQQFITYIFRVFCHLELVLL